MTKRVGEVEENITRIELEHGISAGIRMGSLGSDMVPLFDEHAARLSQKMSMNEWYAMDRMERAVVVAVWRIDQAMRNHQAEAEIAQSKRSMHKGK